MTRLLPRARLVVLSAIAVIVCASVARAQTPTLGEVAKKEAERRKAQPAAGKVYTNKDLPSTAQKPAAAATPPADASAPVDPVAAATQKPAEQKPAEQKPADAKPEADQKGEAYWKGRITAAREELRRSEMFAEALQARINALNKDFASRDNPVQRSRAAEDRNEALAELNRVKHDVDRGKKQIADIEEEARKAGVPPAWVR
jgi:hypothetical protein